MLRSIGIHCATMHGIHCNQSESTAPHCMESTAFNRDPLGHAAWNPLHSTGIHLSPLHGMHCVQSGCILPCSVVFTAFNHNAWNPLHQLGCILSCCLESTAFNPDALGLAAWTPLHTIRIHCATMHGILAFIDAAGSSIVTAVVWGSIPGLGTSICCESGPRNGKKTERKKERKIIYI